MNDKSYQQRRRQYILDRARYRQTLIRQRDDEGIPTNATSLSEQPTSTSIPSPSATRPATPDIVGAGLTDFEHHHNAVRLYIAEQFEQGKSSREIGEMIGLTPWRITRWYNQVRHLPPAARLWTPLLTTSDIKKLQREAAATKTVAEEGTTNAPKTRERRPSKEEIKAARKALKAAAKANLLADDQKEAEAITEAAMQRTDGNEDVARRVAAAELYAKGWTLSRVARALTMDVSTVSRWMSRVRAAGESAPESVLGIGQDKRGSLANQNKPAAKRGRPARIKSAVLTPRPRRARATETPSFQLVNTDTAMGKRAIGLLRELFRREDTAPTADPKKPGDYLLPVRSATERERVLATLSMLGFAPGKPTPRGTGFVIPVQGKDQSSAFLGLLNG